MVILSDFTYNATLGCIGLVLHDRAVYCPPYVFLWGGGSAKVWGSPGLCRVGHRWIHQSRIKPGKSMQEQHFQSERLDDC